MPESPDRDHCDVCGQAAPPRLLEHCFRCGGSFHFDPYRRDATDCGVAELGEDNNHSDFLVDYLCNTCVDVINGEAAVEA